MEEFESGGVKWQRSGGVGLTVEQGGQLFGQGQRAELVLVPLQQTHLLPTERESRSYCTTAYITESMNVGSLPWRSVCVPICLACVCIVRVGMRVCVHICVRMSQGVSLLAVV